MEHFCFRLRFFIEERTRLGLDKERVELCVPGADQPLVLRSYDERPIADTDHLLVVGRGFGAEDEATGVGERVSDALLWRGLSGGYGLDLGGNPPRFFFFNVFKRKFKEATGAIPDANVRRGGQTSDDSRFRRGT